jgi:hypothetical protein
VAEGARLESVYTLIRIEGSNPSLSAIQNRSIVVPFKSITIYLGRFLLRHKVFFAGSVPGDNTEQ